jgi:hypothetical protein
MAPDPTDELEEAWMRKNSRIPLPPGALSTQAVIASLFLMTAIASGILFSMYSSTRRQLLRSDAQAVAEPSATGTPVAMLNPISLVPAPIPTLIPPPICPSSTAGTATRAQAVPADGVARTAPRTGQQSPAPPRVHVYPFPVFGPSGFRPSAAAAQPSPGETSETNPYDDVSALETP